MMVAGGIVAGVFLIFIEIAYKKHRGLKEKELELAKTAADRWRGNIEVSHINIKIYFCAFGFLIIVRTLPNDLINVFSIRHSRIPPPPHIYVRF